MKTCFFCNPERARVLYESEHFYVLLGLGPIIEGYALLVAKHHIRSMIDMPFEMRSAYIQEKRDLKQLMHDTYGPTIVTEHGRVLACTAEDEEAHDLLCYHAHQLFFPIDLDLATLSKEGPFKKAFEGSSLFDAVGSVLREDEEYLLFENKDDHVVIHTVAGKCPRQYMRYLVARSIGRPELASWSRYPEYAKIFDAKKRYAQVLANEAGDRSPDEVASKKAFLTT